MGIINFDERETDALAYIALFSRVLNKAGDVLLVFGEAHQFVEYSRWGLPVVSINQENDGFAFDVRYENTRNGIDQTDYIHLIDGSLDR